MQVYLAEDGWRWRLKAANAKIVASSGEAFAKRSNAVRAASGVVGVACEAADNYPEVEVLEP